MNYAKLPNGEDVTIDNVWTSGHYTPNHESETKLGKTYGVSVLDDRTGMDGFTKKLQFIAPVNPGVKNKLRLFITDIGDTQLDSAVLLQAGSLVTNPVDVPEPSAFLLVGAGALALALRKRFAR